MMAVGDEGEVEDLGAALPAQAPRRHGGHRRIKWRALEFGLGGHEAEGDGVMRKAKRDQTRKGAECRRSRSRIGTIRKADLERERWDTWKL